MGCILQLLDTAQLKGQPFDRILIELSGVAEPRNVRSEFQRAVAEGHPAFDAAELSTILTVVDSPHFFDLYSSKNDVADHAVLLGGEAASSALDASYEEMRSVEVERSVVDLLVEQVHHDRFACHPTLFMNMFTARLGRWSALT
jgi:G3E family GTPase